MLVIGLFKFSISSWFSFGMLYILRNISIPSSLSNLLAYNFSEYLILCISVVSVISPLSFLILFKFSLFLSFWGVWLKIYQFCWSFQRTSFWFHWSVLLVLVSISFISALIFIISGKLRFFSPLNFRVLSLCCPLRGFYWWGQPAIRPDICSQSVRVAVSLNHRALFLCCPAWSFCLWVGPAVRSDVCPSLLFRGCSWPGVCGYLPFSQGRSHFGVVLATVRAACSMRHQMPWRDSCWARQLRWGGSTGECGGKSMAVVLAS